MRRLLPALLLVASTASVAPAQSTERHALSGERVAVWNLAGRAEIVAGSGREVIVEVTRGGDDAERLTVEATGGRLVVKYPGRSVEYRGRTDSHRYDVRLSVNEDGTFSGGWDDDRDGRSVRITSNGGGLEAYADLRIQVPPGQRIAVYVGVGEVEATNVNGEIELRTHASSIRGRGIQGRITARTGSGRIVLENVSVDRAQVSTGSGSVDLNGFKADELRASTGSGSIEGRDVTAARFDASTGSGGVRVESLTSTDVRASTGSGSMRLAFVKAPSDVTARTGSGSVSLVLPADVSADLDIRTGSGGISTDFPVTMEQMRRNEMRGRIGSGTGARIRVNTGSGSVRLIRE